MASQGQGHGHRPSAHASPPRVSTSVHLGSVDRALTGQEQQLHLDLGRAGQCGCLRDALAVPTLISVELRLEPRPLASGQVLTAELHS